MRPYRAPRDTIDKSSYITVGAKPAPPTACHAIGVGGIYGHRISPPAGILSTALPCHSIWWRRHSCLRTKRAALSCHPIWWRGHSCLRTKRAALSCHPIWWRGHSCLRPNWFSARKGTPEQPRRDCTTHSPGSAKPCPGNAAGHNNTTLKGLHNP